MVETIQIPDLQLEKKAITTEVGPKRSMEFQSFLASMGISTEMNEDLDITIPSLAQFSTDQQEKLYTFLNIKNGSLSAQLFSQAYKLEMRAGKLVAILPASESVTDGALLSSVLQEGVFQGLEIENNEEEVALPEPIEFRVHETSEKMENTLAA